MLDPQVLQALQRGHRGGLPAGGGRDAVSPLRKGATFGVGVFRSLSLGCEELSL